MRLAAAIGRILLTVRRRSRGILRSLGRTLQRIGRSPLVAAPVAAASVVVVSLTVVGLVVAGAWWGGVEPAGPWQEALAITGTAWVMSYGVPVQLMGTDFTLIPWGLALIPLWLSHQAGRWLIGVVRPGRWRTLVVTWGLTVAIGAVMVGGVSTLADLPDVQTNARQAMATAVIIGLIGVGSGMWRASALPRQALVRIPKVIRVMVRASAVGFVALVGIAAIVLAIATARSFGEIVAVFASLEPTLADAVVLTVISLGYLPTLVGWAMAYVVGAGISLGPDVLVTPFVAAVPPTPLPTFPPLAALPEMSGPVTWALPALTILAGALIGLSISRWAAREGPLIRISLALIASALTAAGIFGYLWLSSGALGDGRLAVIGPDPGLGSLLAGVGLVIGALPTSVLRARRRSRRLRVVHDPHDQGVGANQAPV